NGVAAVAAADAGPGRRRPGRRRPADPGNRRGREGRRMNAARRWERAANVLAVRLDQLGDVLMTTPALRALRESRPGRRVTLLTSPAGAAVAPLVPVIDDVIVYDAPWVKATAPRRDSRPEYEMADRLRRAGFDAA